MNPFRRTVVSLLAVSLLIGLLPELAWGQEATGKARNLLANASFEAGVEGWKFHAYGEQGKAAADPDEKRAGKPSVRIDNAQADDSFLTQKVTVKPGTRYRLSGWIKTKSVGMIDPNSKNGASLAIEGGFQKTESIVKTSGWKRVTLDFVTGPETEIELGPRLGHHGAKVSGTAWFADLSLVELGAARR